MSVKKRCFFDFVTHAVKYFHLCVTQFARGVCATSTKMWPTLWCATTHIEETVLRPHETRNEVRVAAAAPQCNLGGMWSSTTPWRCSYLCHSHGSHEPLRWQVRDWRKCKDVSFSSISKKARDVGRNASRWSRLWPIEFLERQRFPRMVTQYRDQKWSPCHACCGRMASCWAPWQEVGICCAFETIACFPGRCAFRSKWRPLTNNSTHLLGCSSWGCDNDWSF